MGSLLRPSVELPSWKKRSNLFNLFLTFDIDELPLLLTRLWEHPENHSKVSLTLTLLPSQMT